MLAKKDVKNNYIGRRRGQIHHGIDGLGLDSVDAMRLIELYYR